MEEMENVMQNGFTRTNKQAVSLSQRCHGVSFSI